MIRRTGFAEERIEMSGRDEIKGLTDEINSMLEAIDNSTRELIAAKLSAAKANRAKSEFLANMSRELRTPLKHIMGFSELMADQQFGPLNSTQLDHMADVIQSGRHLLARINDILDLTKVEPGKLVMHRNEIGVKDTGIGLTAESLVRIFTPFEQEVSRNRSGVFPREENGGAP
jgi:signal transduction histidine kinase